MREMLRAAFVIARRDFTALIFSRSFVMFLITPLFMIGIGIAGGGVGDRVSRDSLRPVIGVLLAEREADALLTARADIAQRLGDDALPDLRRYSAQTDPAEVMAREGETVVATLSGTLAHPILSGLEDDIARLKGDAALLISVARAGRALPQVRIETRATTQSSGSLGQARLLTGQAAQILLFLLTMLLAGMVLSNMVEEKTNKIIEILAAAVPIDAIFLGKLFAMLAMSFLGIFIWGSCALLFQMGLAEAGAPLTAPAVGWPMFILLGMLYFAMAYMLLGALYIGIGAQANTVREVQTLSMPTTMAQLLVFFFASYTVNRLGEPVEITAAIFPFSSPFAMIARAAQSAALWPHLLALGWQMLCVTLIIRIGVRLFRRTVLKSGPAQPKRARRIIWRRPVSDATDPTR